MIQQGSFPFVCVDRRGLLNCRVRMRVFLATAGVLLTFAGLTVTARRSLAWDGPLCSADGTSSVVVTGRTAISPPPSYCQGGEAPQVAEELAFLAVTPLWVDDPADQAPLEGVEAWNRFVEHRDKGDFEDALLQLAVVEAAFPHLADRFALARGLVRMELGEYDEAVSDFLVARESLDGAVRARSRIFRIESKILGDHADANSSLAELLRFYPALPDGPRLRLALAQWNERRGEMQEALRIYRDVYLTGPGTSVAQKARARLEAMRVEGVPVRAFSPVQEVARVETLARRGPHTLAREEALRLLERSDLTEPLKDRVHLVAARLARVEGRLEDAARHLQAGGRRSGEGDEDRARQVQRVTNSTRIVTARQAAAARKQIGALRNGRVWMAVPPNRLLAIVRVAAGAELTSELNEALNTLLRLRTLPPVAAFEAGVLAAGTGADALVAGLFAKASEARGNQGVAARYHHARTLERMGNYARAERGYHQVAQADRSETGWYRLWSEMRLRVVREALLCNCNPDEPVAQAVQGTAKESTKGGAADPTTPSLRDMLSGVEPRPERTEFEPSSAQESFGGAAPDRVGTPTALRLDLNEPDSAAPVQPDLAALADRLGPLVEKLGEHYPWFARARDLLRLGLPKQAADELHEAYLARRDARGRPLRRVGLEAVFRGDQAPAVAVAPELRRARRSVDPASLAEWIEISSTLGDEGTAVGLSGWARANDRPRPYEELVNAAAEQNGLDPNLLLAVMRTESVYQRRIVSYAGAIGLMQIMPRTGRHIAFALEKEDYGTDDLLDPATNLEFAAWYLASLIERFDGHLPLAIASYNGGPHNVRNWLRKYSDDMPMEAFLERIPFEQTHRYVRRVLGHYAAYRAQKDLPMVSLQASLPEVAPDPIGF